MNYFDCMKFIKLNGFQEFNLKFPHFREYFFNPNFIYVFEHADGYFRLVSNRKYFWQNIFEPTYIICDDDLQKLLAYAEDKLIIFQNNKDFDEWFAGKLSERKQEKKKSIEDEKEYESLIRKIGISEFNLRMPHLRKRFFNPSYIYVFNGKQSIYKLSSLGKEGKYAWHDLLKTKNKTSYSDLENLLVMAGDDLKVFSTPLEFSKWFVSQMTKISDKKLEGFPDYKISDELFFPFIPEIQLKMLKKLYDEIYPKVDEKILKKPIIGSSPLKPLGEDLHELLTRILEDRKNENSMYGTDSEFHPLKVNKNALYGVFGVGKTTSLDKVKGENENKDAKPIISASPTTKNEFYEMWKKSFLSPDNFNLSTESIKEDKIKFNFSPTGENKKRYLKFDSKSYEDSQKSISDYFDFRNSTPEQQKEHVLKLISEKIISEKQDEAKEILRLITDDEKSTDDERRSRLFIYKMFLDTLPK